jgi:LysR family transcriptional activator of the allD operon
MLDQEMIRTFLTVAETASFSDAAKRLHKTTATISYRIKLLEENTGAPLFSRTTRSVLLTPAGLHLLERSREWLAWLDAMPAELRQINDGVERQVNIVINNLLYHPQAVARLMAHLVAQFPLTQFTFTRQIYMGVWDALLHDDFALAIGVSGNETLSDTVEIHPLGEIDWIFVMAANHPLAQETATLTEAKLRQYPAINIEDSARRITKRVAWRLTGQKEIQVSDLETKLAAHVAGVGIGFLPSSMCQPYLESGALVARVIPAMRPPSSLSLAWHKEQTGKAALEIVRLFQDNTSTIARFITPLNSRNELAE